MSVEGLILAAGLSSRLPEYKMNLVIGEKTILQHTIENMKTHCTRIIVVSGHNDDIVKKICSKYQNVKVVYNKNYLDGMYSSIKIGFKNIKEEKFFMMPGDIPMVKSNTFIQLSKYDEDVVIPSYKYKAGHPILIKSKLAEKCLNSKVTNLREFLNSKNKKYVDVDDEGVLLDIDTYEDYKKIKRMMEGEDRG